MKPGLLKNGQAAVEQFEKGNIDVIATDCEMPIMDGFEATSRIREIETSRQLTPTPIIALTAHVTIEDRERTANVGMNDFLSKPFTLEGLQTPIAGVTANSGSQMQTTDSDLTIE